MSATMKWGRSGITANTPNYLLLGPGALYKNFVDFDTPGDIIAATVDGAEWKISGEALRRIPIDGAGDVPVKGLMRPKRRTGSLSAKLREISRDTLLLAIPGGEEAGAGAITVVPMDVIGTGDGIEDQFTCHADLTKNPTIAVEPAAGGVAVVKVLGTHYTVVLATGVVTFTAGNIPITDDLVIASYQYDAGGPSDHYVITPGEVSDASYLNNVALVCDLSGFDDPIVFVLDNAISTGDLVIGTKDEEEAVLPIELSATYDPAAITVQPWKIWYPVG